MSMTMMSAGGGTTSEKTGAVEAKTRAFMAAAFLNASKNTGINKRFLGDNLKNEFLWKISRPFQYYIFIYKQLIVSSLNW